MIKIGLIGAGFMGTTHSACYEILQKQGILEITAVADLDRERAAKISERLGADIYSSGMELIDKAEVDAIDICLPTYLHAEHAVKAMDKGCNVFVEKPVCLNRNEAEKLLEAKNRSGVKVMAGHCIRFWPEYIYLKELMESKSYGRLKSAVFKRVSPRPDWAWEDWIIDVDRSGSAALDLHIHDVDFVRYILGEPENIKTSLCYEGKNPEHAFSIYEYGDVQVLLEGGWDYPASFPFEMEYRVKFEQATVVFNSNHRPAVTVYPKEGEKFHPSVKTDFEGRNDGLGGNISSLGGYYNELKYFYDCIANNKEIETASLEEGLNSLELILRELKA